MLCVMGIVIAIVVYINFGTHDNNYLAFLIFTNLCTYYNLLIYTPTPLPIDLPTCPRTHLIIIIYLIAHPLTDLFTNHPPTHLSINYYLLTCLAIHPPTFYNIPTYVLHNLVMMCQNKHMK
jgi:hypothetical protein